MLTRTSGERTEIGRNGRSSHMVEDSNAIQEELVGLPGIPKKLLRTKKDPKQIAFKAIERKCVRETAVLWEAVLEEDGSMKCGEDCTPLPQLLDEKWALEEDAKKNKDARAKLDATRQGIHQRLFSASEAEKYCKERDSKPRDEVVEECLKGFAQGKRVPDKGRSHRMKAWFKEKASASLRLDNGRSEPKEVIDQLDLSKEEMTTLSTLVVERYHLELKTKMLSEARLQWWKTASRTSGDRLQEVKKILEGRIKNADADLEEFGFEYKFILRQCTKALKKETAKEQQQLMERLIDEAVSPVIEEDNMCIENATLMCPEGLVARYDREFDRLRFAAVYGVTAIAFKPAVLPLAFVLGTLVGGPALGATFAGVFYSLPGTGFIAAVPVALVSSMDILQACRCFAQPCRFNSEIEQCEMSMAAKGTPKNPFRHLPYPGGKCVVDGDYMTDETPRCKLQMCNPEDYSMSHISKGVNISGKIGRVAGEPQNIYNCLSASGDATSSIAIAKDIELEGQEALKNTVENRVVLYRKLGVEEADV